MKTYSCSICKGTKTEIVAVELEKNVAVPTNYSLKANSTTGISLTMTAPSTDDQQKIDGITYQYNINGDTSLRSLNPGVAGTIFLLSCSNLKAGSNSIAISITANPTAEAASEGYVAGTTSFSATVALTEGAAFDTAGISAVVSVAEDNTKTLTISGLNQNQIYELRDNTGKVTGYICADSNGSATKESISNSIDITELTLWALDFSEVTSNTASINRCAASAKISVSTAE